MEHMEELYNKLVKNRFRKGNDLQFMSHFVF
ncbi:DUF4003 family protein [Virgibacillus byunsanensis]|uniref:DUF4003 family protein n=1 Tax=Virgibacillus byunsanensis TaxID=570945 RepID=A0ABW3LEY2_9BACI